MREMLYCTQPVHGRVSLCLPMRMVEEGDVPAVFLGISNALPSSPSLLVACTLSYIWSFKGEDLSHPPTINQLLTLL